MKIDRILITIEPYEQDQIVGTNKVIRIDVKTGLNEHHFQRILHKSEVIPRFDRYMDAGKEVLRGVLLEEEEFELNDKYSRKISVIDKVKEMVPKVEVSTDISIPKTLDIKPEIANKPKPKSGKVGKIIKGIMQKGKENEQE